MPRKLFRFIHPDSMPVVCRVVLTEEDQARIPPERWAANVTARAMKFFDQKSAGDLILSAGRELDDSDEQDANELGNC